MIDPDPRYVIGIHEAAHAVVGYCLGLQPRRIRIATGDSREVGSTWFAPAPKSYDAFADAICSAAGEIAELKEFGSPADKSGAAEPRYGDPFVFGQPGGDHPVVSDATYLAAISRDEQLRAVRIAAQIVDAHLSAIRSLAREVATFGVVSEFPQLRYVRPWTIQQTPKE